MEYMLIEAPNQLFKFALPGLLLLLWQHSWFERGAPAHSRFLGWDRLKAVLGGLV